MDSIVAQKCFRPSTFLQYRFNNETGEIDEQGYVDKYVYNDHTDEIDAVFVGSNRNISIILLNATTLEVKHKQLIELPDRDGIDQNILNSMIPLDNSSFLLFFEGMQTNFVHVNKSKSDNGTVTYEAKHVSMPNE